MNLKELQKIVHNNFGRETESTQSAIFSYIFKLCIGGKILVAAHRVHGNIYFITYGDLCYDYLSSGKTLVQLKSIGPLRNIKGMPDETSIDTLTKVIPSETLSRINSLINSLDLKKKEFTLVAKLKPIDLFKKEIAKLSSASKQTYLSVHKNSVLAIYEIDLDKYKNDPSIIAVYSTKKVGGVEAYVIRKSGKGFRYIGKVAAGSTTDFDDIKKEVNSTRQYKKQLTLVYGTDVNEYKG